MSEHDFKIAREQYELAKLNNPAGVRALDAMRDEIATLRAAHERAVQLCLQHSIATGHADTADQLMDEVIVQVQELRAEVERRGEALKTIQRNIEGYWSLTQEQTLFKFEMIARTITKALAP